MKIRWDIIGCVFVILLVLYVGFYVLEDVSKNIDKECCDGVGGELRFMSCHVGFIKKECGGTCHLSNGTILNAKEFGCITEALADT